MAGLSGDSAFKSEGPPGCCPRRPHHLTPPSASTRALSALKTRCPQQGHVQAKGRQSHRARVRRWPSQGEGCGVLRVLKCSFLKRDVFQVANFVRKYMSREFLMRIRLCKTHVLRTLRSSLLLSVSSAALGSSPTLAGSGSTREPSPCPRGQPGGAPSRPTAPGGQGRVCGAAPVWSLSLTSAPEDLCRSELELDSSGVVFFYSQNSSKLVESQVHGR